MDQYQSQSQSQSNHHGDDTKSSSDEEGEDRNDDQSGIGRSYECVFCKRGFTTAQALGGHMNIHRKDRANKPRPTSNPSPSLVTSLASKVVDDQHMRSQRGYPSPSFATNPEVNANYRSYIPVPTWHDLCARNDYPIRHHRSLFAIDADDCRNWRAGSGLSLGIGRSANDDYEGEHHVGHGHHHSKGIEGCKSSNGACSSEGDGLDLELRLGHDP